jgi:dihydroorotate dehydrogenase (fumarate)
MDLSSRYLGLNLRNPLVASASPQTSSVDGVRQLAGAGVAAVVLPSLRPVKSTTRFGRA